MGRTAAVFDMVMGIGIIGALASILAGLLVAPTEEAAPAEAPRRAGGRPSRVPRSGR